MSAPADRNLPPNTEPRQCIECGEPITEKQDMDSALVDDEAGNVLGECHGECVGE